MMVKTKALLTFSVVYSALSASLSLAAQTSESFAPVSVSVVFVQPEKFKDVGDRTLANEKVRAAYLQELEKHIAKRAAPLLREGETLTVFVTDVDMAGHFEPFRFRLDDVRIVKDIYPPRIDLNFRLTRSDGSVREGERKLRDSSFLLTASFNRHDPLKYEKALLDRWLERELKL